jgi:hypothetical protein
MYLFMHKSILLIWIDPTGLIVMYAPYSDAVIASQVHCIAWILSHCIQHLLEFSRYKKSEQPLSMCFDIIFHAVISAMHVFHVHARLKGCSCLGTFVWFFFDCLLVALHFFCDTAQQATSSSSQQRWLGKTNFVEVRSFWHLFRSFDRMWTLLVLGLQVYFLSLMNGSMHLGLLS